MNKRALRAMLLVPILALPVLAGARHERASPIRTEQVENPLEALAWLVGGRWVAETPNAPDGTIRYEAEYTWASHKRLLHIRLTRTSADGQRRPGSEGVCWWDPATRSIQLIEVDPVGQVTRGNVVVSAERVTVREVMTLADGTTMNVRTEIERVGADSFSFIASAEQNGEWRQVLRWTFERYHAGHGNHRPDRRPPAPRGVRRSHDDAAHAGRAPPA